MASEIELERMIIRLIGDGSSYQKMLKDAETATRSVSRTVEAVGKKIEAIGGSINKAGRSVANFGKTLAVGVTAPLAAMNGAVIKAGADFDSGFAGVRKTVNGTALELNQLRDGFRALALEIPVSTTELLKIGEAAGQLGIEQKNILSFTKTMAQLAASTNLTVEEGAVDLARFANIMTLPQEQIENLGSSIVALGNNFATSEREILSMSTRLAGAGKSMGLTSAQVTGIATALSSLGMEAEAGGTAMSMFLSSMAKSVALGGKDLEGMAKTAELSVEQFSKLFREDTLGAVNAVIVGLGKLDKETREIALTEMGVDGARMADEFRRLANNTGILKKAVDLSTQAFAENLALVNEANQRFQTFWSKVQLLKNEFADLAVDLFDLMRPALETTLSKIREFTRWLKALSPETKIAILNFAKVAAVLGPVAIALGTAITAVGTMTLATGALTTALTALTWPIVATIAGIAALGVVIGGVIAYLVGADGLAEAFNIVMARVENFATSAAGFLAHFGQNVGILGNWFRDNWKTIIDDLGSLFGTWIGNSIQNLGVFVTTGARLFAVFAGFVSGIFKRVFSSDFLYWVVEGVKQALSVFTQFAGKAWEALRAAFTGKKVDFGDFVKQLEKDFQAGAADLNPIDAIQKVLEEQAAQLRNPLEGFKGTTPLPELILSGMPEVPRNALADKSALGAIAAPFEAAAQPGSKERVAVQQFADRAGQMANGTVESLLSRIAEAVEKDPTRLVFEPANLGSP